MKDSIEFYVQFIAEIENNPELYNHRHSNYNNKRITEKVWIKVGKKFDEKGADCRSKWKSIRSAYIRSLNTKTKTGSVIGTKKDYYLAPYLLFLNPFVKKRSGDGNIPIPVQDDRDIDSEYDIKIENTSNNEPDTSTDEDSLIYEAHAATSSSSIPSPHSSLPIKTPQTGSRKHISEEDTYDYTYRGKKKKVENQEKPETQQKDPCEMFLLSLVPHVTSMSQQQQLSFQRGVLELIENIKYRQCTKYNPK